MSRAGFSLLEVLLALIIAALVMAALSPALTGSLRAQRRAFEVLDPLAAEQAAFAVLRDDLLGTPRPDGTVAEPLTVAATTIDGANVSVLAFTTCGAPPVHPSLAIRDAELGQARVTWSARASDDGTGLAWIRTRQPHLLATGTPPAPPEAVMLDHLARITVESIDGDGWATAYDSGNNDAALPAALRVRFAYLADDGTAGPLRTVVLTLPQVALDPLQAGN